MIALYAASTKPPKRAGRADVIKLQAVVSDIKAKLGDTSGVWQDISSCTIVEPRKFGEEEKYFCEVQYERFSRVHRDDQVRTIIDQQVGLLRNGKYSVGEVSYPTLVVQEGDTFRAKQAGSATIHVNLNNVEQNCALGYTLGEASSDGSELRQRIRCYIDTDGTYLQKVDRV